MEKNDEKRYAIIEEVEIAENGEIVVKPAFKTPELPEGNTEKND